MNRRPRTASAGGVWEQTRLRYLLLQEYGAQPEFMAGLRTIDRTTAEAFIARTGLDRIGDRAGVWAVVDWLDAREALGHEPAQFPATIGAGAVAGDVDTSIHLETSWPIQDEPRADAERRLLRLVRDEFDRIEREAKGANYAWPTATVPEVEQRDIARLFERLYRGTSWRSLPGDTGEDWQAVRRAVVRMADRAGVGI